MKGKINYSIDCGGSTLDIVKWVNKKPNFYKKLEMSSTKLNEKDLITLIKSLPYANKVALTGGKSKNYQFSKKEKNIYQVNEIDAIGKSASFYFKKTRCLVASLGTGTCLVGVYKSGQIKHLGGSGVGGGSLFGLSRVLLKTENIEEIVSLCNQGETKNIDLSVKEIIGGDLGNIPGEKTAANLAKLTLNSNKKDIAAGIVNLTAQSIGVNLVMTARFFKADKIILSGKLTRIKPITDQIKKVAEIYKMQTHILKDSKHLTAIGAGIKMNFHN